MSTLLLLCGDTDLDLSAYQDIAVVDLFRWRRLSSASIRCRRFFDFSMDESASDHLCAELDRSLQSEHLHNPNLRWAPLALMNIHYRLVRYLQFRRRIEFWLDTSKADHMLVSSDKDPDLVLAAKAACIPRGIRLTVHSGRFDELSYSLSANLHVPFYLPEPGTVDPPGVSQMVGRLVRARRFHTLAEPYSNLKIKGRGIGKLSSSRSVSSRHGLMSFAKEKLHLSVRLDHPPITTWPDPTHIRRINDRHWEGLDEYDRLLINSVLHHFYIRYPVHHLDRLAKATKKFLNASGVRRIVVAAAGVPMNRLFCWAARQEDIQVDYLPHGVIWETAEALNPSSPFAPDRVLSWNKASKRSLIRSGAHASVIGHPRNRKPYRATRPLKKKRQSLRVIVLLTSRILSSMEQRLDCYETDLLDILDGLGRCGITRVDVKYHHTDPGMLARMAVTIRNARAWMGWQLQVIDSSTDTQDLMETYDLVIIGGPTTGILEAMRSSTPFIVFRGFLSHIGTLAPFDWPAADSAQTLAELIDDYDEEYFDKKFRQCDASLKAGPNPLEFLTISGGV